MPLLACLTSLLQAMSMASPEDTAGALGLGVSA